ncbi:uncharacterized protein METZ01_LOCUS421587, partial [marine metagenome]
FRTIKLNLFKTQVTFQKQVGLSAEAKSRGWG